MKKKIIITLGPSSLKNNVLKEINKLKIVDLFRINLSHTSISQLKMLLKKLNTLNIRPLCIDTEGAQIRTSKVKKKIFIKKKKLINIFIGSNLSNEKNIFLYPYFSFKNIKKNTLIKIGFEDLVLKVIGKTVRNLKCIVLNSGYLESNKGVHILGKLDLPAITNKDYEALKISKKYNIKYFALSFANSKDSVKKFRKIIGKNKFIISKIETKNGYKNRAEILKNSDAGLIDRGDLSRYVDISKVPIAQKEILITAKKINKKIYIATNLLETMVDKVTATRAESNDIFNSLNDGANGLVLAAETAIGKYPIKCLKFLHNCIKSFEKYKKGKFNDKFIFD